MNYASLMLAAKMIEYGNAYEYGFLLQKIPPGHLIVADQSFLKTVGWSWFCGTFVFDGLMSISLMSAVVIGKEFTEKDINGFGCMFGLINILLVFNIISPFPYMAKYEPRPRAPVLEEYREPVPENRDWMKSTVVVARNQNQPKSRKSFWKN